MAGKPPSAAGPAGTLAGAPVRLPKAAQIIADSVREQIASGDLLAGSPLPNETELMAHFEVARPTAREALRILEAEGLIEVARGARGGARVRRPDLEAAARNCALLLQLEGTTLAEVYEVRLMLEPTAARLAAERGPRRRAARALEAVIDEEERRLDQVASLGEQAMRFQETLVDVAGNPTLALLVKLLHELVARQAAAGTRPKLPDAKRKSLRRRLITAQRGVTEAIREGRGEDAELEWRAFLVGVRDTLVVNGAGRVRVDRSP